MSDAEYIEIPLPKKKKSFLKTRFGLILLFLLLLCLTFIGSWIWQVNGKVTSVYATVDASIFTVEPETPVLIREVLIKKGDKVFSGQPLAVVELPGYEQNNAANAVNNYGVMPMGEITGRLNASEQTERNMSARISQARIQEERFQQAHQNYVTQHVRAQLALRAADPANPVIYATAQANEAMAKAQMEQAREQFESVSKMRAAMEAELARIRNEILRKKNAASRAAIQAKPLEVPVEQKAPSKPIDTTLLAPANGKIIEILTAQGQQAQAGQPLFYIMPSNNGQAADCWIKAWYPSNESDNLKTGQKAVVKIGEWTFGGQVAAVVPTPQELPAATKIRGETGEFTRYTVVRIVVDEPQALAELGPGTNATCVIQTRQLPWFSFLP